MVVAVPFFSKNSQLCENPGFFSQTDRALFLLIGLMGQRAIFRAKPSHGS
jgi:hypothetical protein